MRLVGNIPHPVFTISVFSMNEKYIVKLEGGPMEQIYKFPMDHVNGLEGVKEMLTEDFIEKAREIHNSMYLNLKSIL